MAQIKEINGYVYVWNDETVTQHGVWGVCNFTGDISTNRNGQINYKLILTSNPTIKEVQQLSKEEVEYCKGKSEVEVKEVYRSKTHEVMGNFHGDYKIIIPKEEPKFENSIENTISIISMANFMFGKKEEPKQEIIEETKLSDNWNPNEQIMDFKQQTLEEAILNSEAHNNLSSSNGSYSDFHKQSELLIIGSKLGAKWMQERSYSGEEVLELLEMLKRSVVEINHIKFTYKDKGHCVKYLSDCETIIEQFKKK